MKSTTSLLSKETFSALLLTAGLFSGTSFAAPPAQVTICHIPPGNPANAHEITVGARAVTAHVNHGDTMGACPTGGGPVVFQETEFDVCDNRQGETGRKVKINKQGTVVSTHSQCN